MDGTITQPILDFDLIRREMGIFDNSIHILEAMSNMNPAELENANKVLDCHEKKAAQDSILNEGVADTVCQLKKRNIKTAILTRNHKENVRIVIEKHNLHFDAIFDREDGPAKPDPFGVNALCTRFGLNPSESLVIGDYIHDLETAKAAGALAVLIKTHKQAEDFQPYADISIESINEIISIIDNINDQHGE